MVRYNYLVPIVAKPCFTFSYLGVSFIDFLKENGIVIFIDRSVDDIIGDVDISKRPLLKEGKEKVLKLYEERYLLYKNYADEIVVNNKNIEDTKNKIIDIYNNL